MFIVDSLAYLEPLSVLPKRVHSQTFYYRVRGHRRANRITANRDIPSSLCDRYPTDTGCSLTVIF